MTTPHGSGGAGTPGPVSPYGSRPRPTGGAELYAWLFMRTSGVLLLLLALGHLFTMHLFNSVHSIDYDFVAARYLRLFWRGYDMAMLWLALIHGLNGIRTLADDYLRPPLRVFAVKLIYMVGVAFLVLGTWAIIGFNPTTASGPGPVPGLILAPPAGTGF